MVKYTLALNVRHAKFAARLIAHMKTHEDLAVNVVTVRLRAFFFPKAAPPSFTGLDNRQVTSESGRGTSRRASRRIG